jgi:glycosyltransferase involved in cell wall biosynthesis
MAAVRIFLPTYRRPALLPRALAGLRAQTCRDWVCELHNDAPDDPIPGQLLAELGDPRITLVTHPGNLGGTATFNLFFRSSTEPFYSILEDDNWWEPDFLATMLATAAAHPVATVFWANMRIAQEQADGSFSDTGRTIWPEASGEAVRLFPWGQPQQICGALHSNGAALFRSRPGQDFQIPAVPFAVIEPFRERMLPHPLVLVTRPLATFSLTLLTARSRDAAEWAETQAMLAATFFQHCPWNDEHVSQVWADARAARPIGTTNLILAALAQPECRGLLRHAQWRDWWVILRGFIRRPGLYFRIRRSRRNHADWWQFLEEHTGIRWSETSAAP